MDYITNMFNENQYNTGILITFVLVMFITGKFRANPMASIYAFSLGNRTFSTTAIVCTLIATWVSASGFNIKLIKFYDNGWKYLLPSLGMILGILFIAIKVAPNTGRLLGSTSVASYMGRNYGDKVRVITAIIGIFSLSGCIAIQFRILGEIAYYLYPILEPRWLSFFLGVLTVYYCYLGGVRSVIYTDVIQALIFTVAFIISIVSLQTLPKANISTDALLKFNVMSVFNSSKEEWMTMGSLFFYFMIPALNPAEFQRISLGINVKQVQLTWIISCIGFLFTILAGCYVAYELFLINPTIDKKERLSYFLSQFYVLKPFIIVGILSMAMSTADSCINISAVMLANDTYQRHVWTPYKKLQMAKFYTIVIGALGYGVIFLKDDLLDLIMFTNGFYMPLITIPLMMSIFGYKISEKCVLISIGITTTFWIIWQLLYNTEPLIFTMTLNGFLLFVTHYLIDKKILKCFWIRSKLRGK